MALTTSLFIWRKFGFICMYVYVYSGPMLLCHTEKCLNVIELETKTANQVAFVELVLTLTNE